VPAAGAAETTARNSTRSRTTRVLARELMDDSLHWQSMYKEHLPQLACEC